MLFDKLITMKSFRIAVLHQFADGCHLLNRFMTTAHQTFLVIWSKLSILFYIHNIICYNFAHFCLFAIYTWFDTLIYAKHTVSAIGPPGAQTRKKTKKEK